jgi:hypothetical protein
MCWSRHEREQWLRRREEEHEAERLRTIPSEPRPEEPVEPELVEEREEELVRA